MVSVDSFSLYTLVRILNKPSYVGCDETEWITALASKITTGYKSEGISTKAAEESIK